VVGNSTEQAGVAGRSERFVGIWGDCPQGRGVHGQSINDAGVYGYSEKFAGVLGETKSADQAGVFGRSERWQGVHGESVENAGVVGYAEKVAGVWGDSPKGQGVHGQSIDNVGVYAVSEKFAGIWAESKSETQPGIFSKGPKLAARFEGDLEITRGDIRLMGGDCAELFRSDEPIAEGSLTVLDREGFVRESRREYDRAVAGVVAGAGHLKPGIVLGDATDGETVVLVSLVGRVCCNVDASRSPIAIGDIITTSPTPGYGMAARDPERSFGAIIGKALAPINEGMGLIPILIALQ
jgi:hypothetical protein